MKIAFIGQKGIPTQQGGIEKHVEELSARLAKAGIDITVYSRPYYTNRKEKSYFHNGIRVINLPSIKTKNLDAITHTFISSVHALFQNYDIIHYHGVGPSLLSWIPRIFSPKSKVIVTFHCTDRQHQKWGLIARLMLTAGEWTSCHFPHETIVVSQTLQKYCLHYFKRVASYIPNGVQTDKVSESNILTKYGLKQGNYFLLVSRLIQHKGVHTLIKAYKQIETPKKLVIVGDGSNTNDYVRYLKEISRGNDNIIFTGKQTGSDLNTLFTNAFMFIQPSEAEGLSIALLEAMSYGIPVLISDIEENQEVTDGYGLEFKNKNSADLARQLNFAIKHPRMIKERAIEAKKQIDKKYNWQDITKQTIALYQKTLSGKSVNLNKDVRLATSN